MRYFKHTTQSNKNIHVFDDVFDNSIRTNIYRYLTNSVYRINGYDTPVIEEKNHISMTSLYNDNDLINLGFDTFPKELTDIVPLERNHVIQTMVNLCRPDDVFHLHTDFHMENSWTMLYYANLKWDLEWGGDTMFLAEDEKNLEYLSLYTPGRIVLFDGRIPHLIRPSTRLAPDYRFTLAIKFVIPHG